jgi:hypothetical protein
MNLEEIACERVDWIQHIKPSGGDFLDHQILNHTFPWINSAT